MAFWIRKEKKEFASDDKKRDEKKTSIAKRVDNLRISQQLRIVIKSLGTPNMFEFKTKDLSATGAFVLCPDFSKYPFHPVSTILDCAVELKDYQGSDNIVVTFLAKIARVVEPSEKVPWNAAGFGIRIVSISHEQRLVLEHYIARHGMPENAGTNPLPAASEIAN